jgi:hypothetical protein
MGHLFQGRYKAILIDAETYLLELIRYIHLNPVRAGIVARAEDYRWSSQRAYVGREKLSWLSTDWVLSQFSKRKSIAHKRFRDFIYEGIGEGRREEFYKGTKEGCILGDDRFVDEVLRLREARVGLRLTLEQILQRVCDRYGIELESITASGKQRGPSEMRGMISWIVREAAHLSLMELSKRLNRDISSLSVAARRLVEKSKIDTRLAKKMAQLKSDLL